MIHYFYGTLQVGIGQTLYSFEHVSCYQVKLSIKSRLIRKQDAMLSHGVPRDAAVNFGTYQSYQRHRAVFTAITTLSN